MEIKTTSFEGLFILQPKLHKDQRGVFLESFRLDKLEAEFGHKLNLIQDNETHSNYGVIRGMHYQLPPYAQSKLIRVVQGKVWDVVVDLRPNSMTFKKSFALELSDENNLQLFIPRGFAHGFCTLSQSSIFQYKVDNYHHTESERGLHFNDTSLEIDWKVPKKDWIVSEKDMQNPYLEKALIFDSNTSLYE